MPPGVEEETVVVTECLALLFHMQSHSDHIVISTLTTWLKLSLDLQPLKPVVFRIYHCMQDPGSNER